MTATIQPTRPVSFSPQLDQDEQRWWDEFAEIEEKICWVQTEAIRKIVRKPYLRRIIGSLKKDSVVVDFGCGAGWLAKLLAEYGATKVVGVDFSEEQIRKAQALIKKANYQDKVSFVLGTGLEGQERADVVLCHAFLHHLSWVEIDRVMDSVSNILASDGSLFLLEPVQGTKPVGSLSLPALLIGWPFGNWFGLRKGKHAEQAMKASLASRESARQTSYGASPKEMPFSMGELEKHLSDRFKLVAEQPALMFAHNVGAKIALFGYSHPILAVTLGNLAIRLASLWDRFVLSFTPLQGWEGWVFYLYEFKLRPK